MSVSFDRKQDDTRLDSSPETEETLPSFDSEREEPSTFADYETVRRHRNLVIQSFCNELIKLIKKMTL